MDIISELQKKINELKHAYFLDIYMHSLYRYKKKYKKW